MSAPSGDTRLKDRLSFFQANTTDRILIAGMVYTLPWLPILSLPTEGRPLWLVVLSTATFCLAVGGSWLKFNYPRLALAPAFLLWTMLFALHVFLNLFGKSLHPPYFWGAVLFSSLFLFPFARKRLGEFIFLFPVGCLILFLSYDLWFFRRILVGACLAGGTASMVALHYFIRRKAFATVSGMALMFFFFSLMIYPRAFIAYRFVFPGLLPRVLAQPGVHAVYHYGDDQYSKSLPRQVMFLGRLRGSETFFLGPQKPYHQLIFIFPHQLRKPATVELGSRGSDNFVLDPDDPDLVYVGAGNRLLKISAAHKAILQELTLEKSIQNLNFIQHDPLSDRFFISEDAGDTIHIVDRKTFTSLGILDHPPGTAVDDVWIDAVGNQILVDHRYFLGRRLDAYDLDSLQLRRTFDWPWDFGFNFSTVDEQAQKAYLGSTISGRVRIVDLPTMREIGEFRLPSGLRNLNFDAERRWLLIGGYFAGELYVYDVDRRAMVGSLFLGMRIRWVAVDADDGKWYVTTSVGGFCVTPEEAFPARPPSDD